MDSEGRRDGKWREKERGESKEGRKGHLSRKERETRWEGYGKWSEEGKGDSKGRRKEHLEGGKEKSKGRRDGNRKERPSDYITLPSCSVCRKAALIITFTSTLQ